MTTAHRTFRTAAPGLPALPRTRNRREDRDIDECIGICRGILADGAINQAEVQWVYDWLQRHRDTAFAPPFDQLATRLHEALVDGVLDSDEEADLLDTLVGMVGGEAHLPDGTASRSTDLPLDLPAPAIVFAGRAFVVTGTFVLGPRGAVVGAIEAAGGSIGRGCTHQTDYLIVGELGSRDWAHSSMGRKIERALELREAGAAIAIIGEAAFAAQLPSVAAQ